MLPLVDKEAMNQLLTKGRRSKTSKTKTLAQWATREIRKLKNASSWWAFLYKLSPALEKYQVETRPGTDQDML